jgi:alkylhydroperoxidase family enzyme
LADVEQMLKATTPPGHEPLKLFRVLANNPPLLDAFRRFGTYFLRSGSVAPRDREIIIQRTTARCGAAYELVSFIVNALGVEAFGRAASDCDRGESHGRRLDRGR